MLALQIGLCLRRQPRPVPTQTVRCCGILKKAKLPLPHAPTPIFKAAGKQGGGCCPAWPRTALPARLSHHSRLLGDFGQGGFLLGLIPPPPVPNVQRPPLLRRLARVGRI